MYVLIDFCCNINQIEHHTSVARIPASYVGVLGSYVACVLCSLADDFYDFPDLLNGNPDVAP